MSWTKPRIGRVHGAEHACTCDAQTRPHDAVYRAESINTETGEVRTGWLCSARAATILAQHGLAFPPGMWE